MKRSQQGVAIAIVVLGLLVLAAGATVLISQLLKERAARQRLEREVSALRLEVEKLREQRVEILLKSTDLRTAASDLLISRSL